MGTARSRYVAGMPELSYTGLSENWLLKTCGDQHWQQLAASAGLQVPDFRDANGNQVYAAFTTIRVRDASLHAVGENDVFNIDSHLAPAGSARYLSEHAVVAHGGRHATVAMLSTFIRRTLEGDNQSVVRAMPTATERHASAVPTKEIQCLASLARRFRSGEWGTHLGLDQIEHACNHTVEYLPCPYTDFNGANLLYFASFQAMVDRAEWQWREDAAPPVVHDRDLFFHGNVNLGEPVEISFRAVKLDDAGLIHWCEIRRSRDGEKIADVVTKKRWR